MGWYSLAADGVSGGILILWDSRVLEIVGSCVSYFSVSMDLKNVEDGVSFFFGCMVLMMIVEGDFCGRSWRVFVLSGIYLGVLREISMLFISQVNT